jgi:hypothetical protein
MKAPRSKSPLPLHDKMNKKNEYNPKTIEINLSN